MRKDSFLTSSLSLIDWDILVYIQLNTSKRNEDTALAGWLIKFTEETPIVGQYVSTIDIENSWLEKLK